MILFKDVPLAKILDPKPWGGSRPLSMCICMYVYSFCMGTYIWTHSSNVHGGSGGDISRVSSEAATTIRH